MDKIKAIEHYAKENDIPIMEEEGIVFLCEFIKRNNITTILEIGSAIGYSAIRMALVDKHIRIITIERDDIRYYEAVNNVRDLKLEDQIEIFHEDALSAQIHGYYDMIFIDAAKAQYMKFFEYYENNLANHGYIISDNLKFHGFVDHPESIRSRNLRQLIRKIKDYTDYLVKRADFDTEFLDVGDGLAISKRK